MKLNNYLLAGLHGFVSPNEASNADDTADECDIDTFGVGAMMPQELLGATFLADTKSYGI